MGLNCVSDLMSSDRVCDNCLLVAAAGAEDFSPPMFSAWDARGRMALARGDSLFLWHELQVGLHPFCILCMELGVCGPQY